MIETMRQLIAAGGAGVPAVRRDDLPAETINFNGESRSALRVSAAMGERLGFAPGDIVIVAPPTATQPTDSGE